MSYDITWLRELEEATKNSVNKMNAKCRTDALRRSGPDISVHTWSRTTTEAGMPMWLAAEEANLTMSQRAKSPGRFEISDSSLLEPGAT